MGDASDHTIVLALNRGSSSLKLALYSFAIAKLVSSPLLPQKRSEARRAECGCAESPRCSSMNLEASLAPQKARNI